MSSLENVHNTQYQSRSKYTTLKKSLTTLLFENSPNMVCPIDQFLLESERPFSSQHFDTSFEQIDRKF